MVQIFIVQYLYCWIKTKFLIDASLTGEKPTLHMNFLHFGVDATHPMWPARGSLPSSPPPKKKKKKQREKKTHSHGTTQCGRTSNFVQLCVHYDIAFLKAFSFGELLFLSSRVAIKIHELSLSLFHMVRLLHCKA
ncbi:hypothetical protein KP509_11G092300 [Ceratopteris richardii]|uniref:Uncharacterized protein n=1 Tax=Ceratopteris richardii TaxID=49495 RepID=A0A8T2TX76_CERRI|nr:hypothetical protein KP509_11G092300 [Ceratopteris richardii]